MTFFNGVNTNTQKKVVIQFKNNTMNDYNTIKQEKPYR